MIYSMMCIMGAAHLISDIFRRNEKSVTKFKYAVTLLFLMGAVACSTGQPAVDSAPASAPVSSPAAAVGQQVADPTAAPTSAPMVVPTSVPATAEPTAAPTVDALSAAVDALKSALVGQDYAQMEALMSDLFAVGGWRSEWRTHGSAQAAALFQDGSLPAPTAVEFSDLTEEEISALIGQPPASMFAPDVQISTALHSSGWGPSGSDEAILFLIDENGQYRWSAFLYTSGRFADARLGRVAAPVGLIYRPVDGGVYQIQFDGQHRQLLDAEDGMLPNLRISPDGRFAAYLTDDRHLWLIDTGSGERRRLAAEYNLSTYLAWADNDTLFAGVWLSPDEADGPNVGHITTIDVENDEVFILDEGQLSASHPAMAADGQRIAYAVLSVSAEDILTSRLYAPDTGLERFDPSAFTAQDLIDRPRFNPAWSADGRQLAWLASTGERVGLQIFDLEVKTAVQIFDWDPARFGAILPAPAWSADGQWLALEIYTNNPADAGTWLIASDGSSKIQISSEGMEPHWVNESQLVYLTHSGPRFYDVSSGDSFEMDLPQGSWVFGVTSMAELEKRTN